MDDPTPLPGRPNLRTASWDDPARAGIQNRPTFTPTRERNVAMRALGAVVYAVRVGDLIKIGHTSDLATRVTQLHADEILAVQVGTRDDEQALHARLDGHQHHGVEWYFPTRAVMVAVNEMREALGLEPIAA